MVRLQVALISVSPQLSSACACISLVTNLTLGHSFVYICFFILIGRREYPVPPISPFILYYQRKRSQLVRTVYANSLFATLNARQRLRSRLQGSVSELSSIALHDMPPGPVNA